MAFNQDDLYLTSGTGQVINNWVDPVYKFDSSSFYNWEQDNLPIYDLEDRDDYLWEMAGYPASATAPTIMLTVSDCGIDDKKVFGSLSGAIEALPNTLRQPVIIEVCVSGQLGHLRLENKEITPSGGLEIINRGFAKSLCGSAASVSSVVSDVNAVSAIGTFSSLDTSNTMTNAFCVGSQVRVGNKHATTWEFWSKFNRTFMLPPEWAITTNASQKTVGISTNFDDTTAYGTLFGSIFPYILTVTPYSDNSASSDIVIWNYNPSPIVNIHRSKLKWSPTGLASFTQRATGLIYNNTLSTATIKNCSGRIYLRGFCVDGATQAAITSTGSQRTDIGFDIDGSEVVLENCTATRCKKAGLKANNSEVILNRGFIATNNYELEDFDGGFLNQKKTSVQTPGLKAVNSNVTLSSALTAAYGCPVDSPFVFTRNMVGVDLENSQVVTPTGYRHGLDVAGNTISEVYGSNTIVLQTFNNVNEGIKAKQSLIDMSSRVSSFQNRVGVRLEDSTFKVQETTIDHNQEQGLISTGSIFNYNKNAQAITRVGPFNPLTNFENNGQHVHMKGSQFIPTSVSAMDTIYERMLFNGNHMRVETNGKKSVVPAVEITNGSYMNAVCPNSFGLASKADSTSAIYDSPVKGAAFSVTDNSNLDINGTGSFSTYIVGPNLWSKSQRTTGLYAGKNSSIHVAGPTSILQWGVDALAEEGSTIKFAPQEIGGVVDASGWSLFNTANHTKTQLHATRACLVAADNSNLVMQNLGDYHKHWNAKYLTGADYPTGNVAGKLGAFDTSSYFSDGHLQFYPNPFAEYGTGGNQLNLVTQAGWPTTIGGIDINDDTFFSLPDGDGGGGANDVSSLSYGGFCVRAVGGSTVKANNILFPAGWENASGPYYDASTTGLCDLVRIWNIGDTSKLHASYLSVGNATANAGTIGHPQDLSSYYYGPSALWTSDSGTGLSGAPSSTVNTSSASVLDSFGLGTDTGGELGYYGKTTRQNIGPFRIYVGVDPKANFLGYPSKNGTYSPPPYGTAYNSMGFNFPNDATLITGPPKQLFAQGYSPSGDCSAINNQGDTFLNASAIFQDLGFSGYITSLPLAEQIENVASSFFYPKDMLPSDSAANIWLDESAMNTFANAKNGTLGTSGRKKIFSYYKAITDAQGEGFFYPTRADGIGSINLFDLDRYL